MFCVCKRIQYVYLAKISRAMLKMRRLRWLFVYKMAQSIFLSSARQHYIQWTAYVSLLASSFAQIRSLAARWEAVLKITFPAFQQPPEATFCINTCQSWFWTDSQTTLTSQQNLEHLLQNISSKSQSLNTDRQRALQTCPQHCIPCSHFLLFHFLAAQMGPYHGWRQFYW